MLPCLPLRIGTSSFAKTDSISWVLLNWQAKRYEDLEAPKYPGKVAMLAQISGSHWYDKRTDVDDSKQIYLMSADGSWIY